MRTVDRRSTRGHALALVGAAAILLGLLGMHYLTVMMPNPSTAMVDSSSMGAMSTPADLPNSDAEKDCSGACDGTMVMAGMACVLGAVATGLLLLIGLGLAEVTAAVRALAGPRQDGRATAPPPRPPSLDLLSISRT